MADRYTDWSSREIEELLMLDRREGLADEELKKEFDRRCTEALDGAFEELLVRYPNVVQVRKKKGGGRREVPKGNLR